VDGLPARRVAGIQLRELLVCGFQQDLKTSRPQDPKTPRPQDPKTP
jgi:hypothetical protein